MRISFIVCNDSPFILHLNIGHMHPNDKLNMIIIEVLLSCSLNLASSSAITSFFDILDTTYI